MKSLRPVRQTFWGLVFAALSRRVRDVGAIPPPAFSVMIRGGLVYDGTGAEPVEADIGLAGDRVAAIGDLGWMHGRTEIDASGLAVAPGFINSLSWATESIIEDPTAESDLRQGVTLEVFGEGQSMGPLNSEMRRELRLRRSESRYPLEWHSLGEYLEFLEKRGIVPNVTSLVGATTVRIHELGYANRAPTAAELIRMQALVRTAMTEGALGVGSSLIYAPAAFAGHDELRALALAAAEFGGAYYSHLRSESRHLLLAVEELIDIAKATRTHAEIWHFKAAGRNNWRLLAAAIDRIETARAEGLDISANVYPYLAGASGFDAAMPPWVQEGGHDKWIERLRDSSIREQVVKEIEGMYPEWESLYAAAGSAENVQLLGFRHAALQEYCGLTLAEVAKRRGRSAAETIVDLVLADDSRVHAAYFMMSEENLRRLLALPWVGICSDEEALAPRGAFLQHSPHPRAYGSFARFLGHYVRDEGLLGLAEAIRRLTSLPARNLSLTDRGVLRAGAYADTVIFDPWQIRDLATYAHPHQFAKGMRHVVINGQLALRDGAPTGARPGRFVRGPGAQRNLSGLSTLRPTTHIITA
ncbi:MAG: D-aminoacylase [Gammaproteobacteria bacterium]|nr:D-aminoacylase [Gammaproteobacteria bacterium]